MISKNNHCGHWILLLLSINCLGLSTQTVLAGGMGEGIANYQAILTLTAGADFVQTPSEQFVVLYPPFENFYTVSSSNPSAFDGGIFLGIETKFLDRFWAQFGVAAYFDTDLNVTGDVWQFGLPRFDNLNYSYDVQTSRYMLGGKLLTSFAQFEAIHPYFSWEIGAAVNRAANYLETSFTPGVPPMPPFTSNTQASFAWGVGLGIDYSLTQNVRLGCGYQYANLGSAALGATPAAVTSNTINWSNLNANQLRFQLSVLY